MRRTAIKPFHIVYNLSGDRRLAHAAFLVWDGDDPGHWRAPSTFFKYFVHNVDTLY